MSRAQPIAGIDSNGVQRDVLVGTNGGLVLGGSGPTTGSASTSIVPASDANMARETYSTVTIVSAQTNATGSSWTSFGSQACTSFDIVNATGTDIEYRRNGAGTAMPILSGTSRLIQGITNANQISIRRIDQSNTQVTVVGETFVV